MKTHRRLSRGFSLIELMVGLVILAVLLGLGVPAMTGWMVDSRVRSQAEYVLSGLQLARGEAVKTNALVRFQLVSNMTSTCALSNNSNLWVVSLTSPVNNCQKAIGGTVAPVIFYKGERERATTATTTLGVLAPSLAGLPTGVADPELAVCFTGTGSLGRYNRADNLCSASRNPSTTSAGAIQIDITDPTVAAGCISGAVGSVRCLRIQVSPGGDARLCDPAAIDPNDPRRCT